MGLFSIDIEKFYNELDAQGKQLRGIFCLQYPVYCIHANITDETPDALDNLDNLIVDFLFSKPDSTAFQIASLIGTSKHLIEQRISKLIQDKLLQKNGAGHVLTELGIEVFSNKTQKGNISNHMIFILMELHCNLFSKSITPIIEQN